MGTVAQASGGDMDGLSACAPGAGYFLEYTGDPCTAARADSVRTINLEIPDREFVPVAANQELATSVAEGARALVVVNIAGVDVMHAVLDRDLA